MSKFSAPKNDFNETGVRKLAIRLLLSSIQGAEQGDSVELAWLHSEDSAPWFKILGIDPTTAQRRALNWLTMSVAERGRRLDESLEA